MPTLTNHKLFKQNSRLSGPSTENMVSLEPNVSMLSEWRHYDDEMNNESSTIA